MALSLARLPRYLVLEPVSTVRFEVRLSRPACEIDVELENPRPGRSFLLLIGPQGGPLVQRMRLTGRARLLFEPKEPRDHVLMLANPQKEPLVLKLRGRRARPARAPIRRRRGVRDHRGPAAPSRPAPPAHGRPAPAARLPLVRSGRVGASGGSALEADRPKG